MNIETRKLEDRQIELTVNVPSDRVERAMRTAARGLSKKTRLKGFRPGKAPYQVVLSHFGEDYVFEEALDILTQDMYRAAIEEADVDPFAPGALEEVVSRDPLVLRYSVPLAPEVDLGDYKSIRIPFEPAVIEESDVEQSMDELRERRAIIEPKDGPVELEDLVVVDIKAELIEPGEDEEAVLFDRKGMELVASKDSEWPMPGIADELTDMKAGDEKQVEHTFNKEYPIESLHDRKALFTIACQDVKTRSLPEWDDELAQSMGEFDTVDDLRERLRDNLQTQADRSVEAEYSSKIVDELVENAAISYPPILLESELDQMLAEFEQQLSAQHLTLEDYIKIQQTSLEDIRADFEPQARSRLDRGLALGELVDVENVTVTDDDIEAHLEVIAKAWNGDPEDVRKAFTNKASRRQLELDLLTEKAMQFLIATAKGEDPYAAIHQPEDEESEESADNIEEDAGDEDSSPAEEQVSNDEE